MAVRGWAAVPLLLVALATPMAARGADPGPRIEAARQAWQRGDLARTAKELEAALIELQARLGKAFSDSMPATPAGWRAEDAEVQGLGAVGGGLAVTRAYENNDSTMNASLIMDSPAVEAAAALLANEAATNALPNVRRLKVGGEDALIRWDGSTRAGEITMVLGGRILLEIQGDNLKSADILAETAKAWNLAAIRKAAGL